MPLFDKTVEWAEDRLQNVDYFTKEDFKSFLEKYKKLYTRSMKIYKISDNFQKELLSSLEVLEKDGKKRVKNILSREQDRHLQLKEQIQEYSKKLKEQLDLNSDLSGKIQKLAGKHKKVLSLHEKCKHAISYPTVIQHLEQELARSKYVKRPFTLVIFELKNFNQLKKGLNDIVLLEKLLKNIKTQLMNSTRDIDTVYQLSFNTYLVQFYDLYQQGASQQASKIQNQLEDFLEKTVDQKVMIDHAVYTVNTKTTASISVVMDKLTNALLKKA